MKRARLIYNPSSGRELTVRRLGYILDSIEEAGYETSAFATKGAGDAQDEAVRAVERGFDLVIAAGGDGTLYEVINGLAGKEKRPKLGILPMGTTNDFARAIGMPRKLESALEVIKKGVTQAIDIGKMNDKYFINIAGGGTLTELTYEIPSRVKTVIGPLAYYLKGLEKIAAFHPFQVEIELDNKTFQEEISMFLVSNTNSVGGFEKLAPLADYSDGLLDVLMVKKCGIAEMGIIMSHVLKGEHLKDPKVIHFKTNKIKITPEHPIQINLDGEMGGYAPCDFGVLEKHIEVIVNKNNRKR